MIISPFNKGMGAVIRGKRMAHGTTQAMLGKVLDVSFQQIQKFESGLNGLSAHQLTKIAGYFGVSVSDLCDACQATTGTTSPAQNDGFLAARYVARIKDAKVRSTVVDFTRKLAFRGAEA